MVDFLNRLFTSAAPLILASLGTLFTELAGILGIFIEGFMSAGAFFAWIIAGWTGSALWGTFISACAAGLGGWGLARLVRKTHANPFIAGLAVNIAAGGITNTLSVLLFGTKGVLRNPDIAIPGHIALPLIKDIPGLGAVLSGRFFSVYLSWFVVIAAVFFLEQTPWGMRLKASGLSPEAAKERGIRPGLYWEGAWGAAAFLAAVAGAVLCFRVGAYTPGGIAGRGWISIAAVYLGFRTVGGIFIASLAFALAEHLSQSLQGLDGISSTAMLGLPYAATLVLYGLSQGIKNRRTRRPYPHGG
ncbi:MAG: ABC transporter permease [Spirochaetaceae bacterium]|jgi:simple sugar transport system permease protein|nr:ABC transporter permease [Spirochaetaceae bacterium]